MEFIFQADFFNGARVLNIKYGTHLFGLVIYTKPDRRGKRTYAPFLSIICPLQLRPCASIYRLRYLVAAESQLHSIHTTVTSSMDHGRPYIFLKKRSSSYTRWLLVRKPTKPRLAPRKRSRSSPFCRNIFAEPGRSSRRWCYCRRPWRKKNMIFRDSEMALNISLTRALTIIRVKFVPSASALSISIENTFIFWYWSYKK